MPTVNPTKTPQKTSTATPLSVTIKGQKYQVKFVKNGSVFNPSFTNERAAAVQLLIQVIGESTLSAHKIDHGSIKTFNGDGLHLSERVEPLSYDHELNEHFQNQLPSQIRTAKKTNQVWNHLVDFAFKEPHTSLSPKAPGNTTNQHRRQQSSSSEHNESEEEKLRSQKQQSKDTVSVQFKPIQANNHVANSSVTKKKGAVKSPQQSHTQVAQSPVPQKNEIPESSTLFSNRHRVIEKNSDNNIETADVPNPLPNQVLREISEQFSLRENAPEPRALKKAEIRLSQQALSENYEPVSNVQQPRAGLQKTPLQGQTTLKPSTEQVELRKAEQQTTKKTQIVYERKVEQNQQTVQARINKLEKEQADFEDTQSHTKVAQNPLPKKNEIPESSTLFLNGNRVVEKNSDNNTETTDVPNPLSNQVLRKTLVQPSSQKNIPEPRVPKARTRLFREALGENNELVSNEPQSRAGLKKTPPQSQTTRKPLTKQEKLRKARQQAANEKQLEYKRKIEQNLETVQTHINKLEKAQAGFKDRQRKAAEETAKTEQTTDHIFNRMSTFFSKR